MISAAEYRMENAKLMVDYEHSVRNWLRSNGDAEIAERIPFFRDGVVCPEVWFQEGNDFRPLFILKEVSLGIDDKKGLECYLNKWGNPKYFEFVENPFDDIKVGTFSQWRRIAKLAKGFEELHKRDEICDYYQYDFGYVEGGEIYTGDIEGYKDAKYRQRTANRNYIDIIDKMAVLEIKKVGGGTKAGSAISMETKYYTEHISPFKELLYRQIKLINPTVIIGLGRENGDCISALLEDIKTTTEDVKWIKGYHHIHSSNEKFYYEPLRQYKGLIMKY